MSSAMVYGINMLYPCLLIITDSHLQIIIPVVPWSAGVEQAPTLSKDEARRLVVGRHGVGVR